MKATFVDLEFDTAADRGAPLGDIASSLVTLHDLLRDLATLAAYPASAEFREIQVVAIEMRSPLTVKLSLLAIPPEAVKAFQEICRAVIHIRERRSQIDIKSALARVLHANDQNSHITEKEVQRLHDQMVALQNAEVPLKRVIVKEDR
jgi:hypothetical protein